MIAKGLLTQGAGDAGAGGAAVKHGRASAGAGAFLLPIALAVLLLWPVLAAHTAMAQVTPPRFDAKQLLIQDYTSGNILLAHEADTRMYPASMTKIMTVFLIFERLKSGQLSLDDYFDISAKASKKGGSKMFLESGGRVRLEDLIRGIIVQSGNDATIVAAEGISGSEEEFVKLMNETARNIGMENTHFTNASGWPNPEHYSTAYDMAVLADRTITDFPDYYHFYGEREFTYNDIKQQNRNPLLARGIGVDGLKTGHTKASGYGLAVSAVRGGQRVVMVLNGLKSSRARALESENLINWAFRQYKNYQLFEAGDSVGIARVWQGQTDRVPLIMGDDLSITIPKQARSTLRVTLRFQQPALAPIPKGRQLGELTIEAKGIRPVLAPVLAGENVAAVGPIMQFKNKISHMLFGTGEHMEFNLP